MELSTAGQHNYMPACVQRPRNDGSIELSTVHAPAWELSFYTDICKVLRESHQIVAARAGDALSTLLLLATHDTQISVSTTEGEAATIIETAKRVTGLSIKDLAEIFQVSRQTLYNYRKSQDNITDKNWERLRAVEHHIELLAGILPHSPGSLMKRFSYKGNTLYNLLSEDVLDSHRIQLLTTKLARHMREASGNTLQHSATVDQLTHHA